MNGWGSVDPIQPNPPVTISIYQQNPSENVIDRDVEATADMFMNWVYKKQGLGGFLDNTWTGSCYPKGCNDNGRLNGQVRMNWMDSTADLNNDMKPDGAMPRIFTRLNWN